MTGRLLYQSEPYLHLDKHTHLVFKLCNQGVLSFHDTRKFGYCAHLTSRELQRWPYFATLGPEPLTLDEEAFVAIFQKSKARIKAVLLDQRKIAGIGNIYADEALHVSGIHPATPCSWLAQETLQGLSFALKNVLLRSIGLGGSTLRDYVDSLGNRGRYQDGFLAYGRKGLPCTKCSTRLESCKVAGRTSVYCPSCQPMLDPE
jgi:formamidopyrimidine-DNA glycosylase